MPVQTAVSSVDLTPGKNVLSLAEAGLPGTHLRQTSFLGIVSQCPEMHRVFSLLQRVAKTDVTVLVLGESGTGKELVANAVHKLSGRKGKLVPVNCAAIPEEILESELFGHEKGSFTGATSQKMGRFQLADGGTIFLDEIGEMSPKLQAKLLRVLQDRVVEPVGSTRSVTVNVRVIAATNKDLRAEVDAGRFRGDLYYRLQGVPVELPALRMREGDVGLLLDFFLQRAVTKFGLESCSFSPEAFSALSLYRWPGNIRELENLVERLVILSDGEAIDARDLPSYIFTEQRSPAIPAATHIGTIPEDGLDFNDLVDQYETGLIVQALSQTGWNKKAAARLLGLNRTTLVEKIRKKGLERLRGGDCSDSDDASGADDEDRVNLMQ